MMPPGGIPSQQQVQQQQQQQEKHEEQRKELLQKILTPEAQERLARIALVKPDKVGAAGLRAPASIQLRGWASTLESAQRRGLWRPLQSITLLAHAHPYVATLSSRGASRVSAAVRRRASSRTWC